MNDTALIQLSVADTVDDSVTCRLFKNGDIIVDTLISAPSELNLPIVADSGKMTEFQLGVSDPDTTETLRFNLFGHWTPVIDSITASSQNNFKNTLTSRAGIRGVSVMLKEEMTLELFSTVSRIDTLGDPAVPEFSWLLLKRPDSCTVGKYSCYEADSVYGGPNIKLFSEMNDGGFVLEIRDGIGAFVRDTFSLFFPFLDTSQSGNENYAEAILGLNTSEPLVIGGRDDFKMDTISLLNSGTSPLEIYDIRTGVDNADWLQYSFSWKMPNGKMGFYSIKNETNEKNIADTLLLPSDEKISFSLHFFTENLKGDSVIQDTLYITTNDNINPVFKIPFLFAYIDLPRLTIRADTSNRWDKYLHRLTKKTASPGLVPERMNRHTSILFAFSEPVILSTVNKNTITIYSRLDSAKNGSLSHIPSAYPDYFNPISHPTVFGTTRTDLVDTLAFTPFYRSPADSIGLHPLPGAFPPRDVIQIRISNTITDSVGNALDISRQNSVFIPGTQDSLFSIPIDTSTLRVIRTEPENETTDFDPDDLLTIHFNQPIVFDYDHEVLGRVHSLDSSQYLSDTNSSVFIWSNYKPTYKIRRFNLINGDSTLVIHTQSKFYSADTIRVILNSKIGSKNKLTLDGNADGIGKYWFTADPDSSDFYRFSFVTRRKGFYIYPNPFKFSDPAHREKGSITFKNVMSLKGVKVGDKLDVRIHTLSGELVYSSERRYEYLILEDSKTPPAWHWDITNNWLKTVYTGVYLYSIYINNKKMVKKGKLAVIR